MKIIYLFLSCAFGAKMNKKEGQVALKQGFKGVCREGDKLNTYLIIITTVLVLTQIVRVTQNTIQLRRQNTLFKRQLEDLADCKLTEQDFKNQRKAHALAAEYYEKMLIEYYKSEDKE